MNDNSENSPALITVENEMLNVNAGFQDNPLYPHVAGQPPRLPSTFVTPIDSVTGVKVTTRSQTDYIAVADNREPPPPGVPDLRLRMPDLLIDAGDNGSSVIAIASLYGFGVTIEAKSGSVSINAGDLYDVAIEKGAGAGDVTIADLTAQSVAVDDTFGNTDIFAANVSVDEFTINGGNHVSVMGGAIDILHVNGSWRGTDVDITSASINNATLESGTAGLDTSIDFSSIDTVDVIGGVSSDDLAITGGSVNSLVFNGGNSSDDVELAGVSIHQATIAGGLDDDLIRIDGVSSDGSFELLSADVDLHDLTANEVHIRGGAGDRFRIGGGDMAGIVVGGLFSINGDNAATLVLDDSDGTDADDYTLSPALFSMTGFAGLSYAGLAAVRLETSDGDNTIALNGGGAPSITVAAGGGMDAISVGTGTLASVFLPGVSLAIEGSGGVDGVVIDDSASNAGGLYQVDSNGVTRGGWSVELTDVEDLDLRTALAGSTIQIDGNAADTSVVAGMSDDTVLIDRVSIGSSLSVNSGPGSDVFEIGADDLGANIRGSVSINGSSNQDSLHVNDVLSMESSYTISGDSIGSSLLRTNAVSFAGIDHLTFNASNRSNTIRVDSLAGATNLTLNAGADSNAIIVGDGDFDGRILGNITVNAGTGSDSLTIDDTQDTAGTDTYTITEDSFTKADAGNLQFNGLESLIVEGSPLNSTIDVRSSAAGMSVSLLGNAGNDLFRLGSADNRMDPLNAALTLDGGTGIDAVRFDDQGNIFDQGFTVADNSVVHPQSGTVTYGTVESLEIHNELGNTRTHVVKGTASGTPVTFFGGIADTSYILTPTSKNLGNLLAPVTIHAEAGNDEIEFNDENGVGGMWNVSSGTVRAGPVQVNYSMVESLDLDAGLASDDFTVEWGGLPASVSLNGGTGAIPNDLTILGTMGDDSLLLFFNRISDAGTTLTQHGIADFVLDLSGNGQDEINFESLLGPDNVLVQGGGTGSDQLNVNRVTGGAQILHMDGDSVSNQSGGGSVNRLVQYADMDALNVTTAQGDDHYIVHLADLTTPVNLAPGDGSDTLTVAGTESDDTIAVGNSLLTLRGVSISTSPFEQAVVDVSQDGSDAVLLSEDSITSGLGVHVIGGGLSLDTLIPHISAGEIGQQAFITATELKIERIADGVTTQAATFGNLDQIELNLGAGNDIVIAGEATVSVIVDAGPGNDAITTGAGNDIINGGTGNDAIDAGVGDDRIDGGTGNETIIAGAGNDTIAELSGTDYIPADEEVLYVFAVSHTDDTGPGSLRQAITDANVAPATAAIAFQIGTPVIHPLSALPELNNPIHPIIINGNTQTIFGGDTNPLGPEVVLDGSLAGTGADGLSIVSDHHEIHGLNIRNFEGDAIQISGDDIVVSDNYLGTDASGSVALGNGGNGILIISATGSTIRGNVISANVRGIRLSGGGGHLIQNNFVGTTADGQQVLGNLQDGIWLLKSSENQIGGPNPEDLNVVSGNQGKAGIRLQDRDTRGNLIEGNFVGISADGMLDLGNSEIGIEVTMGGIFNEIRGNIVGGNDTHGIRLLGDNDQSTAEGNVVAGNWVGVVPTAHGPPRVIRNNLAGIGVTLSSFNTIGGPSVGDANVIAGNGLGLDILDGSNDNEIVGNFIGTDAAGTEGLGNGRGIRLITGPDETPCAAMWSPATITRESSSTAAPMDSSRTT